MAIRCPTCGYSLAGLPGDSIQCPECGTFPATAVRRTIWHRAAPLLCMCLPFIVTCVAFPVSGISGMETLAKIFFIGVPIAGAGGPFVGAVIAWTRLNADSPYRWTFLTALLALVINASLIAGGYLALDWILKAILPSC